MNHRVTTQALSGGNWCIHVAHHLAGTSLLPNGLIITGIEIISMGFFQLEEQDSVMKDDFVLWCVNVCLFHVGGEAPRLPETRLEQSRKEKRCVLSVHHLCGAHSGMGYLCELCLFQGASSTAWKAAWRRNCCMWNTDAQILVPGVK